METHTVPHLPLIHNMAIKAIKHLKHQVIGLVVLNGRRRSPKPQPGDEMSKADLKSW